MVDLRITVDHRVDGRTEITCVSPSSSAAYGQYSALCLPFHEAAHAVVARHLRAKSRGTGENRFESFDAAFHERLRQAFLDIAKRSPDRCVVIDAGGSEDEVADAIWEAVKRRFAL